MIDNDDNTDKVNKLYAEAIMDMIKALDELSMNIKKGQRRIVYECYFAPVRSNN